MTMTPTPQDIQGIIHVNCAALTMGKFYLDGPGGVNTSDTRLRRCGWAAVKMKQRVTEHYEILQGVYGALGGAAQTVPRAEITAAVNLLKVLQNVPGDIHMVSDCKLVVDGLALRSNLLKNNPGGTQQKSRVKGEGNQDLWKELMEIAAERMQEGHNIIITKVKAHAEAYHILAGMITWEDFVGNEFADAFAKVGAAMNQLEQFEVDKVKSVDKEAWAIQSRILFTNMEAIRLADRRQEDGDENEDAAEHGDKKNKKKKVKLSISKLIHESNHTMVRDGAGAGKPRWKCSQCLCIKSAKALEKAHKRNESCGMEGLPHGWVDTTA